MEAISGAALAKSFRWRSKATWSEYPDHFTTCSVLLMESNSTGRAQRNMTRIGPSMFCGLDMLGVATNQCSLAKVGTRTTVSLCHSLPLDDSVSRNAHLTYLTCTRTKVVHKTESTNTFPDVSPSGPQWVAGPKQCWI